MKELLFVFNIILLGLLPMEGVVAKENGAQKVLLESAYLSARQSFLGELETFQRKKRVFEHYKLKVPSDTPDLYADALYLPSQGANEKLLILSSGIHGAEGPLGSALQIEFLRKVLPNLNRQKLGILIFHSLNPHGFLVGRRVTQNNVDLNRNFLVLKEDFKKIKNDAYTQHQKILSKKTRVGNYFFEALKIFADFATIALRGQAAKQELTQAFAGGQYSDSQGIYFGGAEYEAQVPWVNDLLDKIIPHYKEILLFDIHTGLGKSSELQMISSLETDLESEQVAALRRKLESPGELSFVSPRSEGFYVTTGDFIDFVHAKAAKHSKVAAFTAEFGTLGDDTFSQLKTTSRILLENQGQHFGFASKTVEEKVKRNFVELFNPKDPKWQERVLRIGIEALERSLSEELSSQVSDEAA